MIKILSSLAVTAALSLSPAFAVEDMPVQKIEQGYLKHAALTQFHRWYLLYEKPEYGIANQLDILDEGVRIKSSLGEGHGHDEYVARTQRIPSDWKNAHNVKSTKVEIADDGSMTLSADITYLNQGILPDGAVRSANLTYTTSLVPTDTLLPHFTRIEITQNADGQAEKFVDAYAENRLRSLAHYWMALIEDPTRDPEPVREILADGFALNFSTGTISDFEGFRAWLTGPAAAVAASTHEIIAFDHRETAAGTFELSMTLDWNGILPDGTELIARTRHTRQVLDTPADRFAKIKQMDVELLVPFGPKG